MTSSGGLKVTLSGYYGCGNAGDEAVLAGIRCSFRRRAENSVALTALSQRPDETRASHGIDAVYRMDMRAVRAAIAGSNLLISGGGSLLQDTTSLRSLLYYLYVMRIAASCKVPYMFYAQGIGPLRRGISRRLVKMAADRAVYITVRDEGSATLLQEIGVTRPTIEVTEDPAFALDSAPEAAIDKVFETERIPRDRGVVGVALRPWGDSISAPLDLYRSLLKEIESRTGCLPVIVPMHHPDDLDFAAKFVSVGDYPIVRSTYPADVVLGLIFRMQAVVAMRLHTLIFAARAGVAPFALAYDPKVRQLMTRLHLIDSMCDWKDFDPADVAGRVAETLTHRSEAVAALTERFAERETAALRNCDVALDVMKAPL